MILAEIGLKAKLKLHNCIAYNVFNEAAEWRVEEHDSLI